MDRPIRVRNPVTREFFDQHLPDELAEAVGRLAVDTSPEEARALAGEVGAHVARLKSHEQVAGGLADALGSVLLELLTDLPEMDEDERRVVRGAAEYFVRDDDARADSEAGGLGDDVFVVAVVCRALGRHDLETRLETEVTHGR